MQPYPAHLVQRLTLKDGTAITLRPIRPEDAEIEQAFVRNLSDESRYFRFMDSVRELSPRTLKHFTQIDYDFHMALIAVEDRNGNDVQVAVARYVAHADRSRCEFAIAVADGWQRRGLGTALMRALMSAARAAGIEIMYGDVLSSNHWMLHMTSRLGFTAHFDDGDPRLMRVEARLLEPPVAKGAA